MACWWKWVFAGLNLLHQRMTGFNTDLHDKKPKPTLSGCVRLAGMGVVILFQQHQLYLTLTIFLPVPYFHRPWKNNAQVAVSEVSKNRIEKVNVAVGHKNRQKRSKRSVIFQNGDMQCLSISYLISLCFFLQKTLFYTRLFFMSRDPGYRMNSEFILRFYLLKKISSSI